jgi:large subunit ribosomal protein L21
MKYAIVRLGGKQFKIKEGETLKIERQEKLLIDVLAYSDDKNVYIGDPVLNDVVVKASVIGDEMSKKLRVGRFRSKSRYHKVKGHRQPLSIIKIDGIGLKEKESKAIKEDTPEKKAPKISGTKPEVKKETKEKVKKEKKASEKVSTKTVSKKGKEKS